MFSWSNSRTTLPSEQGSVNLTLTVLGPFMTIHLVSAGSGASSDLAQDNESARAIPCKDSRGPARLQHRVLGEALAHRHCEWPVTPRLHHPIAQWFSENLDRPVPCRLSM